MNVFMNESVSDCDGLSESEPAVGHTWNLSRGCAAEADTPPRDAVPTVHSCS